LNRSLGITGAALGLWILFGVAGSATAADVCPNLSGQYFKQGEDGQVRITIAQTGCAEIRIDRTNTYLGKITREQHTLRIDGQFKDDNPWLGSSDRVQTAAKFTSAALEITVRLPSAKSESEFAFKFLYVMRSNGDLDIREFDRKSQAYVPAIIAIREQ
jgi:hypothetical protein